MTIGVKSPPVPSAGSIAALMAATALEAMVAAGCQPRLALEAPKDPIVINLNVKIEHEVRIKVDRELETLLEKHPELF